MSRRYGAGATPAGDAEWARRVEKRLARLESATAVTVGRWRVTVGAYGDLVADDMVQGRRYHLAGGEPDMQITRED